MRFLAALFLWLVFSVAVEAKPTRDLSSEFGGDRWRMAQAGTTAEDVTRSMRCPPPHCSRKVKRKWKKKHRKPAQAHHYIARKAAPLPVSRPAEPMDEEQAAAYRVIAELLAGGKVYVKPLNLLEGFRRELERATVPVRGRSLAGIVKPLADKITQVASLCPDLRVISTVRPGAVVRGSGRPSLHRSGKAVDITGNYRCIYAALRTFAGGVSTDAHRVRHVHVSWDPKGREWGRRFAHYRGGAKRTRYARHHRKQYASAR